MADGEMKMTKPKSASAAEKYLKMGENMSKNSGWSQLFNGSDKKEAGARMPKGKKAPPKK